MVMIVLFGLFFCGFSLQDWSRGVRPFDRVHVANRP